MQFRRELDFDDLIETIDQLTDEQIDETVDWQMTESPAAKVQGIGRANSGNLGPNWQTRIADGIAARAIQYGSQIASQIAGAQPNAPWPVPNPTRVERQELPPNRRGEIVIPNLDAISFEPITDDTPPRTLMPTYRRIAHDVQMMLDPTRDILHIRLAWSADGQSFRYQQVGVSRLTLEGLRAAYEILRSEEIAPGRTIAVYLDPEARNRECPIRVFMETEYR